jgi:hypothetical protein
MRQHLSQDAARQAPPVARPHALDLKPLGQLAENRLDAKPPVIDPAGPLRLRVAAALTKWRNQPDAASPQAGGQLRVPVVAVSQHIATGLLDQRLDHRLVRDVGRHHRQVRDDARPSHPHVQAEAIEELLAGMVFAEAGLAAEVFAARRAKRQTGTGKESSRANCGSA